MRLVHPTPLSAVTTSANRVCFLTSKHPCLTPQQQHITCCISMLPQPHSCSALSRPEASGTGRALQTRSRPCPLQPFSEHACLTVLHHAATPPRRPNAADPELKEWVKLPGQFLPQPPADMALSGWRDPFILERPSASSPWWYVMVGAGVKETCGTALVYRSGDLRQGRCNAIYNLPPSIRCDCTGGAGHLCLGRSAGTV